MTQTEPSGTESSSTETGGDDDDIISLETLKAMSYDDLIALCSSNNLIPPQNVTSGDDLIDWLVSEFGV